MRRHLRIAEVAPPLEPVPPPAYGGTERIIGELVRELHHRGHDVTTFAAGDSTVPGRLVPTVPAALWPAGFTGDPAPWFVATIGAVLDHAAEFDVIHSHIEWYSTLLARMVPVPVVTTLHGRLDVPWAARLVEPGAGRYVAISESQASIQPAVPWAAVIHNGLALGGSPFGAAGGPDLAFVGRITPEKGVAEAIEIALHTGRRLRIAAKSGKSELERTYLETVFKPALRHAGSAVEWLGELNVADRNQLLAESRATIMPGEWPEPFGLVAIESMACGTPVVARRVGALPEIVRSGQDGFLGQDLGDLASGVERAGELDRAAIRRSVLERFSAERMTDGYEALFEQIVGGGGRQEPPSGHGRTPARRGLPIGPARAGLRFDPPVGGRGIGPAARRVAQRSPTDDDGRGTGGVSGDAATGDVRPASGGRAPG